MEIPCTGDNRESAPCPICLQELFSRVNGEEAHQPLYGHVPYGKAGAEHRELCCLIHAKCMDEFLNSVSVSDQKCMVCRYRLEILKYHDFVEYQDLSKTKKEVTFDKVIKSSLSKFGGITSGMYGLLILRKWTITDEVAVGLVFVLVLLLCAILGGLVGAPLFFLLLPYCSSTFFVLPICLISVVSSLVALSLKPLIVREVWIDPSGGMTFM
jgi:hypothetical protein